jgi:hypothetical protein
MLFRQPGPAQLGAEWRMELLDESKKPVFRIRLLGESLE